MRRGGNDVSGPQREEVLRERARRLATAVDSSQDGRGELHLILRIGRESFGVPAAVAERAVPLGGAGWSTVPDAPPFIAGLVNIGGILYPLTDIGPVLGLEAQWPGGESHAVLVGSPSWRVRRTALLVGARPRLELIDPETMESGVFHEDAAAGGHETLGVAPGMITVLDLEAVLDQTLDGTVGSRLRGADHR